MPQTFTFLTCLLVFTLAPFCGSAQISENVSLLYNYDDNSLPFASGFAYSDVWGYVGPAGEEVAIVGTRDSILFFDVTDPANVIKLPSVAPGSASLWRDFKTFDHYCYGMADQGNEGLTIVDMDSILAGVAHFKTDNSDFNRAHNLWVDSAQGKLYVPGSNISTANKGLIIYDLASDPWNPVKVGEFNFNQQGFSCGVSNNTYVHDLHVINDTAFLNKNSDCGFFITDLSDPTNPQYIGDLPPSGFGNGYNHSTWVNDDRTVAVVAEETIGKPIYILDISDPTDITKTAEFKDPLLNGPTNNIAHNPFILGDIVFISYYEDGVVLVDISDPANPVRVGHYDTYPANTSTYSGFKGCWGVYPYLPSGNILATDSDNGLFVLEVDYAALPIDWMSFELTDYDKQSFAIESQFTYTGALAEAQLEWSLEGHSFQTLAPAIIQESGIRIASVAERFWRPTFQDFYVRLQIKETDGYLNTSKVLRVPAARVHQQASLFPNPAVSHTTLELPQGAQIQLLDMHQRPVLHTSLPKGRHELDLTRFPAGMYVLQLTFEDQSLETLPLILSSTP